MKVLIVILLAACVVAEQKREAEPSYGQRVSYGHLGHGYGHRVSYAVPVRSYGYATHRIHKREADPEPEAEAEADPWGTTLVRPAYGAVSHVGYGGLGYSGLGYGGLGYNSLGYGGLGYNSLGYGGLGYRTLGYGGLGYTGHRIHKREANPEPEAEAEAEADPWGTTTLVRPAYGAVSHAGYGGLGHSALGYGGLGYNSLGYGGLGYNSLGYGGLGYNSLGYGGLGYNSLGYGGLAHTGHHLGKREADPEAEPSIGYGHTLGHAVPSYGYGGYGYGNLGYGSTLLHRPAYGIRRTYVAPRTYGVYGAHGW
ncbi:unnamed protein product [Meganyctiphanes norvegica]|uniref:Uncharacterized protein n=1 Tax=Meganyctiphanes norvegica TaxID=48144 RepID=A0AAV2QWL6_MEGNR